jgi:energy-coupling factor transporter ATP-binding protein EcfA2
MTQPSSLDEGTTHQVRDKPLIRGMQVVDLFGRYTYRIRVSSEPAPHVILLYGDNGSGKTTILKLLWNLLSAKSGRGHRTTMAQIPFRTFSVQLTNGDTITAQKRGELIGSFDITVSYGKSTRLKQHYPTNSRGMVEPVASQQLQERVLFDDDTTAEIETQIPADQSRDRYQQYLRTISIDPYFLADDRRIYGDMLPEDRLPTRRGEYRRLSTGEIVPIEKQSGLANELEEALWRTNSWLRQQVISGTAQGSQGVDAIYLEVVSQLAGTAHHASENSTLDDVRKRIISLDSSTKQFSEFGLVPHVKAEPFLRVLDAVQAQRMPLIEDVLVPYLDGQRARLDSLQPIESLIRTFVQTVNDFLVDKRLYYAFPRGLRIETNEGIILESEQLSSGERQLLVLLCNALNSRDESALFVIDEPEISLNAKWQRKLIPALLACVQSSGVQFVLATHSIEIITGNRQFLARLRSRSN